MDHFSIILALCRSAVGDKNPAVENHLRRLVKALEKSGEDDKASRLNKLLSKSNTYTQMMPTRVEVASSALGGEDLTPSVKAPVDKETSSTLAQIFFPEQLSNKTPIFQQGLSESMSSLLEEWLNTGKLREADIKPALSLMMFGAPGTGKTLLAHYIAKRLGYPLVVAKLDGLVSSLLGTTAKNIANLFAFSNRYKCILLLDEFDAVAKLRDDPNELGELKRVVNTLLQCLDSRSEIGFTIAITNHEALLDPAVWRRFDIRINVPKPSWDVRVEIIKSQLGSKSNITDTQVSFLAWVTAEYSGSDIEKLTDFIKRRQALLGRDYNFLEIIKGYIQLSANSSNSDKKIIILSSQEDLAYALANDEEAVIPQEKLAELFGKTQSTISRWLKKEKRREI
ncbi:hypothetical protein LCGC14_0087350 [marine sediment metagenome]|uniref:AAA+ ATPase domain-containing protein n=1 Tax=marine sediment metagenome TaxID=412755 RepID=A0A0F9XY52_9ZZZZ|nr:ATP-binding protein [Halomonas sp.]HDZ46429.1 ATP-binding protein [Halomonas sp.]HEB06197.1 ATP-binding protein [Halomonas sp.]